MLRVDKKSIILFAINLILTSILFLIHLYIITKFKIYGFTEFPKYLYLITMNIVNIAISTSVITYNMSMLGLFIGSVVGNWYETYYWYNYISSDFATPAVGMLYGMICAVLIILLAVVYNIIYRKIEKSGGSNYD